jgi:two-component system LytT family sensor kinase
MSSKRLVNIILHVLFTTIVVVIPIFLTPLKESKDPSNPDFWNLPLITFTLFLVIAFYANAYILHPRLLLRKKAVPYILTLLLICMFAAIVPWLLFEQPDDKHLKFFWAQAISKFFVGVFVLGTSTAYRFIIDVIKQEQRQREGMAMELSFLRSQVSPHFMFNTLNSMVALARKKSDKLEPALIELSHLMHYMLYESDLEKVNLSKEIDYIQSYIDLQTLRFGYTVRILFKVHKPDDSDPCIEPMLLIPLIENAFKHGIGIIDDPEIDIQLHVEKDILLLQVSNKFNALTVDTKDKTPGIGLVNLERRLKLLYPHKHILNSNKNGSVYAASLKLQLHDKVPGC